MLWHAIWGLVPVQFANDADSEPMFATFPYYINTSEDEKYIAEVYCSPNGGLSSLSPGSGCPLRAGTGHGWPGRALGWC
jgi:hypothetical protein